MLQKMMQVQWVLVMLCACGLQSILGKPPASFKDWISSPGLDLCCNACSHSSQSLRKLIGSKVKKSMKKADKRKGAKEAIAGSCEPTRFPRKISMFGQPGKRQYMDFYEKKARGGDVTGLITDTWNNQMIEGICKTALNEVATQIEDFAVSHKERLGQFNWEKWLCVEKLSLCNETTMQFDELEEPEFTYYDPKKEL